MTIAEFLTLDALLKTEPLESVAGWLKNRHAYTLPPRVDRAGVVQAAIAVVDHSSGVRHHTVTASLLVTGDYALRCAECGGPVRCAGVGALLVDLAVSEPLRDALLGYGSVDAAIATLPSLREAARRDLVGRATAFGWFDLPPAAWIEVDYLLTLRHPSGSAVLAGASYLPGGGPAAAGLDLVLRKTGQNARLRPRDGWRGLLRPADRAIVQLCSESHLHRDTWIADGIAAGLVLGMLRDRPRVLLADTEAPVCFDATTLSVQLAVEHVPERCLAVDSGDCGAVAPDARRHDEPVSKALVARWVSSDGAVNEAAWGALFFSGPQPMVWLPRQKTLYPVDASVDPDVAAIVCDHPAREVPPGREAMIFGAVKAALRGRSVTLPGREAFGLQPAIPPEFILYIAGTALDLHARLVAKYDFGVLGVMPTAPSSDASPRSQQRHLADDYRRDGESEAAAITAVEQAGLRWDTEQREFAALDDQAAFFWRCGASSLREHASPPVTLMVPEALRKATWRPRVRAALSIDLLGDSAHAELTFDAEGVVVSLRDILAAIAARRRWIVLPDGSISELTEAVADLADDACDVLPGSGEGVVDAFQLGRLDRWEKIADETSVAAGVTDLRRRLRNMAIGEEPEVPELLRAELRPYQRQGLAWLQFLDALGAGGILADDMGLGKTVTALALLLWRKQRDGAQPNLVVCPRSVVGNWEAETRRFAPSLRVARFDGIAGVLGLAALHDVDIVVTSYGLLRRHADRLSECGFRYVILDEAQNIKTASAQTTRAARVLRAERRLALTGTPVENHLLELWSILEFINPGMLGSASEFDSRYARPIEANPGGPRSERLRGAVRPFVLRRTKAQVLTELPPMQEMTVECPLSREQRETYDKLATLARRDVRQVLRERGFSQSHVNILAALLRLRQCAIDPRLVDGGGSPGGKRDAFLQLVRDLRDEGRRALVFSQFVELLTLWREDLDREGIAYEYLDGSTRDRDGAVARFQEGSAPLFLISLRAGGAGLNLTAADTVILCDPWWNPAVEDQAAGRAHRIGQMNAVTVIRLVASATIEGRIEVLKERKRNVADAILSDGGAALRGLSEDDLTVLLGDADSFESDGEPEDDREVALAPAAPY